MCYFTLGAVLHIFHTGKAIMVYIFITLLFLLPHSEFSIWPLFLPLRAREASAVFVSSGIISIFIRAVN